MQDTTLAQEHQFFIHGATHHTDGGYSASYTQQVECKEAPMLHHTLNLSYTASGYGSRIPTVYKVKFNGKWRRVYARCYGNNSTMYIGRLSVVGERLIVRDYK